MDYTRISAGISRISPSATIAIAAKAKRMKEEGIDVVSFATGEPDFDTPETIKAAAKKAMDDGLTKYTPVSGIEDLRRAICEKLSRENSVDYSPEQILVCNGAKQALFNAFMTLCDSGDEVLLPTPCYVSFTEQIKLAGATPVFIPVLAENNFHINAAALKEKLTSKTKAILLNTPNNPTGAVIGENEIRLIANLAMENGIWIITDEIYEKLTYDGLCHVSIASLVEGIQKQSIIINGVSKTFAMTGWRLGYAAGPKEIISFMTQYQGHVTGNVNSIAQQAALNALTGSQVEVENMRKEYDRRRSHMVERLNSIEGIHCLKPDGAFYVFPSVAGLLGRKYKNAIISNDMDLADFLLEEARVAVVPGIAFEYPGHIRLTFAASFEKIEEGLERIGTALKKLE